MSTQPLTASVVAKTNVRWKIFLIMLLLVAINYVDRASLSVAMPLIAKEFNISPAMQGFMLSSFFWTYALMQIPGGMLADRFKPRIIISLATVLWGLFQAIAALSTNATMLVITRLGLGASEAPIYPAGGKLNAIWTTPRERARGATLLDSGAPLGAGLGAVIIAGLIATIGSWRMAFVVAGVGTMLVGWLAWWYIRNEPREHPSVNDAEARYIEDALQEEYEQEPTNLSGRNMDFLKYRSVWCMIIGCMSYNALFYGLLTWMPTYLSKAQGFDLKQMGGATFAIFFSGFVGELFGGWLATGWQGRGAGMNKVMRTLLGVSAMVATASIFSVPYTSNAVLVVVLLCSTLFFLRWCGMYWSIPSLLGTRNKVGFLGGLMNLGGNIAGISVPILVGFIVQTTGSYFLALMFFAAAGVGLLVSSVLINYERKIPV